MITADSLRLEQSGKIMRGIVDVLKAGHGVSFEPTPDGGAIATITPTGSRVGVAIARREPVDAIAHCLQIVLSDLAEAERERAALRERLDEDSEPRLSHERDTRVAT